MEVRINGKDGSLVPSTQAVLEQFRDDTEIRREHWKQQLGEDCDRFADIEREIDEHFRQGGGRFVASLLVEVTQEEEVEGQVEQIRETAAVRLKSPKSRQLQVRLLCGVMLWITTLYCAPRRTSCAQENTERLAGLYPELAALGFGKGCSPALQYKVARFDHPVFAFF